VTPAGTILPSLMYWLIISAVAELLQGKEGTGKGVHGVVWCGVCGVRSNPPNNKERNMMSPTPSSVPVAFLPQQIANLPQTDVRNRTPPRCARSWCPCPSLG
jgi:hypothetical protein